MVTSIKRVMYACIAFLSLLAMVQSAGAACSVVSKTASIGASSTSYPENGGAPSTTFTYTVNYVGITSGGAGADCAINTTVRATPTAAGGTFSAAFCQSTINIPNPSTNINRTAICTLTWTAPAAPNSSYTHDAVISSAATPIGALFAIPAAQVPDVTVFRSATVTIANATDGEEAGPVDGDMIVTLSSTSPTATTVNYTVAGTATPDEDYAALSGSVIIPANAIAASIGIPVNDDVIDDDNETVVVTLTSTNKPEITLGAADSATNTIADDDTRQLLVNNGNVEVDEFNTTNGEFSVVLLSQPTADVTVTITGNDASEATVTPTVLTFTPFDWDIEQFVGITAVDDTIQDGDITYDLTLTPTGGDYTGVTAGTATITVIDDDAAEVFVSGDPVTVSETGTTGDITVVLATEPLSNVVVTLTASDATEATVSPLTLTFTPVNWNVAQTAVVTGVDDAADDGDVASNVSFAVASADSNYNGATVADVSVTTQDNDVGGVAGITVTGAPLAVSESGTTDNVSFVLNNAPTGSVILTLTATDATEASITPATLTFTTANWNVAQSATVTGVDDPAVDGTVASSITVDAASVDGDYDGFVVSAIAVTTTDNDTSGITVAGGPLSVTEAGATATFTVVLSAQPATNVVVTSAPQNAADVIAAPATLTFTPANWNVPQTVTVAAVNDVLDDGDITSVVIVEVDPAQSDDAFDGLSEQVVFVTTTDNDDAVDPSNAVRNAVLAQNRSFMANRASLLASRTPSLFRMANRTSGSNGFQIAGENHTLKGDFALSASAVKRQLENAQAMPTADLPQRTSAFDAWIEGQFAIYNDSSTATAAEKGDFFVGYAGVDMRVMDNTLIGVMGQLDWANENSTTGKVHGKGWMIGPYVSTGLSETLYFDARALWGQSSNTASFSGAPGNFGGDFNTERVLLEARLSGNFAAEPFTLRPDITLFWLNEKQDNFTVAGPLGSIDVPAQTVELGQLSTGLNVSHAIQAERVVIEPFMAGRLIWNFENPGQGTGASVNPGIIDDVHGAVSLGLNITGASTMLSVEANYDGLFADGVDTWGGKLMLSQQF